uniref:SRCR domain-containing protein n=1 Tax=Amphimedon queenslandica TaxID=400682 RepID=A0A1X7UCA1_AMPQE
MLIVVSPKTYEYLYKLTTVLAQSCISGAVRLTSGSTYGAVEVCLDHEWGSICSDFWDNEDASVVCRQLGYSPYGAIGPSATYYSSHTGSHKIIDINCTGAENHITNCPYNGYSSYPCSLGRDANVYCTVGVSASSCATGNVRLVGGSNVYEGRVEVCVNNAWSTVCTSSGWNRQAANVVCKKVGDNLVNVNYNTVGALGLTQSSGLTLVGYFNCDGDEVDLLGCSPNYYSTYQYCQNRHYYDAAVTCESNCTNGAVRLRGSSDPTIGRVEFCVNGIWGTICSDYWDYEDTSVLCNQLGFSPYGAIPASGSYSSLDLPVSILDLNCTGNESSLWECPYNGTVNFFNCPSNHDAEVICRNIPSQPDPCSTGDVRLVDGPLDSTGRLEVCVNQNWGTVCSRSWSLSDRAVSVPGYFTEYERSHYIYDLNCDGNESSIWNCSYDTLNSNNCNEQQDASVYCQDISTLKADCTDGDVRLVGGSTEYEGRVEVCINKAWGTICKSGWNENDIHVACRQLGHAGLGSSRYSQFEPGIGPIFMVSVRCSGSETNLLDCYYRQPFQYSDCGHSYDAGLSCEASCQNGTVRIVSESDSYFRRYGRVEVCISNEWGTICNDYWNDMAATVVCKMLGYSPYGAKALSNTFTEGYLHMHFTKLNCSGSEESIFNCSYNELSNYYCSRYRDASVICQLNNVQYSNCTTGNIRLTGGSNQFEGRVELCVNGVWGSVCDNSWDSTEASTVCKQLGYEG